MEKEPREPGVFLLSADQEGQRSTADVLKLWWDACSSDQIGEFNSLVKITEKAFNDQKVKPYELIPGEHEDLHQQLNELFSRLLETQILCLHHHGIRGTKEVNR